MKLNRYVHIIGQNDQSYWYNGLNAKFFRIPAEIGEKLSHIIEHPEQVQALLPKLYEKLVQDEFLLEDDVDEYEIVRQRYHESVSSNHAHLVILPTLNCNYKCWYCIQSHVPSMMSPETMERIKKHLDHLVKVQKVKSLHLDWFGGEPFMYMKQVVLPLSRYAKELCSEAEIPFINGATTNGYFMTPDRHQEMKEVDLKGFQITLDGDREHHDKVKFMDGLDSAFDRALSNINAILHHTPDTSMVLRINYTSENLSEGIVDEICERIDPDIRRRIFILPRKVWQAAPDFATTEMVKRILLRLKKEGFSVQLWNPVTNYRSCYVSNKTYETINYQGHLLKCTATDDLYREEPLGYLDEDGIAHWDEEYRTASSKPSFENDRCRECKLLPSCMGICPGNYLEGDNGCKYATVDSKFEDSIVIFIDDKINHQP